MKKIFSIFICIFSSVTFMFSTQYSKFKINGLYGAIDGNRKVILNPKYEWINFYHNVNGITAGYSDIDEIYNKSFKLIYKGSINSYKFPTENTMLIEKKINGKEIKALLDLRNGKITESFDERLLASQYGFRDGVGISWTKLIDTKGNVLLTDVWVCNYTFSEGLLAVGLKDGKVGFIDTKGRFVIEADLNFSYSSGPKRVDWIDYYFNEGYALVEIGDKSYLFNKKGQRKEVPENIEVATLSYNSGLALIRDKATGKYGYMNTDFEIVIPGQFTEANDFIGPYAIVTYQEKDAIVDTKGNIYFCDEFCK